MCFEEFTTSPYEMLVLVKQFFQDINQLLQNQETFEKDCSQVYRRSCPGPRAGSSPGETPRLCRGGGLGLACMEQLESRMSPSAGTRGRRGHGTCLPWSPSLSLGWWPSPGGGLGGVSVSGGSPRGEKGLGTC